MLKLKKSLGQHFLKDTQISSNIVELLQITPEDAVLEIGPGAGALTQFIVSKNPKKLTLLEKDNRWAKIQTENYLNQPQIQVLNQDALEFSWENLESCKVISNLPYNVGSVIIWDLVAQAKNLQRAVFMVQKEVGKRLIALPGNKDYGGLSVWVQSFMQVDWGFLVLPSSFTPPPKVDSAVIIFQPKKNPPKNPQALASFIKLVFSQRRKQLQTIFKNSGQLHWIETLQALQIDPMLRPEMLSVTNFQEIVNHKWPKA